MFVPITVRNKRTNTTDIMSTDNSVTTPSVLSTENISKATYDNTPEFELKGIFDCKVVRIYDGDTVWAALERDGTVWRVCCRLVGIDTPEMPSAHSTAMTEYHKRAYAARDRVVELTTDVVIDKSRTYTDASGTPLPSLSDDDLQKKMDAENRRVIPQGLKLLQGKGKYGRYLAKLSTKDGRGDVAALLLREGLATPFMVDE